MNRETPSEPGPEFPIGDHTAGDVRGERRDDVRAHASAAGDGPAIVSISDIHGYLDAARSALTTLGDHPDYDPVVERDEEGRLHWADNDYVLVFNGDLVDRGPHNVETLRLVARLVDEAPAGRVRVTLGNHEMGVLTPALFRWESWFSGRVGTAGRRALVEEILAGHVVAAYRGYGVTYAHAGHGTAYDVTAVNDGLVAAAERLRDRPAGDENAAFQREVVEAHPLVLGMGTSHPKGPGAGLVWLDFSHLPPDAPPQVVGHTRHDSITRKGSVVCENVVRNTVGSPGGEAVLVETPTGLVGLCREADGSVGERRVAIE